MRERLPYLAVFSELRGEPSRMVTPGIEEGQARGAARNRGDMHSVEEDGVGRMYLVEVVPRQQLEHGEDRSRVIGPGG